MSPPLSPDHLARLCDRARRLQQRAGNHAQQLERLVGTADADVRSARAALTLPREVTQPSVDVFLSVLRSQLRRSLDGATTARQLCVAAREQHVAAERLAYDLDDDRRDAEKGAAGHPRRHAVLVVDDYPDNREIVSMVLRDAGFVVRTATNGLEALIAAYEMQPAVIVMDVMMPVLDGVEATRLIKSVDAIRHARVIAYTAKSVLEDACGGGLFDAVLHKPVPPEVVLAMVQQLTDQ